MVDNVLVIGDDASFESFDGEGEDVGHDEVVGCLGIGTSKDEAHYWSCWVEGFRGSVIEIRIYVIYLCARTIHVQNTFLRKPTFNGVASLFDSLFYT